MLLVSADCNDTYLHSRKLLWCHTALHSENLEGSSWTQLHVGNLVYSTDCSQETELLLQFQFIFLCFIYICPLPNILHEKYKFCRSGYPKCSSEGCIEPTTFTTVQCCISQSYNYISKCQEIPSRWKKKFFTIFMKTLSFQGFQYTFSSLAFCVDLRRG